MTRVEGRGSFIGLPGDDAYGAATSVFNLAAPATPAVAVTARTVDQIQAAIRYADTENLPVRVHTTGHGAPTARPMAGALLIKADLDGGVEIDAARRLARIAAGTRW